MSRNFQIVLQVFGLFLNGTIIDAAAVHFGWVPSLTKLVQLLIQAAAGALGILAHSYNIDGSTAATVPQTTIKEVIPQPGHGPTVVTAVTEPVQRKEE